MHAFCGRQFMIKQKYKTYDTFINNLFSPFVFFSLSISRILTFGYALFERIASHIGRTGTYWIVVDHLTFGIESASVGTRVSAFLINTRQVLTTFGANDTFGSTIWWRTKVVDLTRAGGATIHNSANTIWPTNIWFTRANGFYFCKKKKREKQNRNYFAEFSSLKHAETNVYLSCSR